VSALGVVAIGLGAYFILLSLQRALVTTPLISSSSNDADTERASATRAALTLTLTMGAIGAGLLAVVGLTIGGPIGDGMLVFAPWLAPTLTQDLLRTSLFRDGHGRAATLTDIAWFGTLLVCVPLAVSIGEIWAVVGAWGLGGLVAASLAGAVMRITPASPSVARTWFVGTAFPFGRWLLLQEGSFVIGFYGLVLLLTPILGATGLGGLRAAETIFAPMSLLAPALVVVGLPAVSRALSRSDDSAIKLAADDKHQFQQWACWQVGGYPREKKGGDKGVDGWFNYLAEGGKIENGVISVKGGEHLNPTMVRDLGRVMERDKHRFGLFITAAMPTKGVREEIASHPLIETEFGRFPAMQVVTIAELIHGPKPKLPPLISPVKKASRVETRASHQKGSQGALL